MPTEYQYDSEIERMEEIIRKERLKYAKKSKSEIFVKLKSGDVVKLKDYGSCLDNRRFNHFPVVNNKPKTLNTTNNIK